MMRRRFSTLLIYILAIAVLLAQPVFADEGEKLASDAAAQAVSSAAYDAAEASVKAKGGYFYKIVPSGEQVKSKGGVMMSPTGDPAAAAPELDAKGAALYSYDLGQVVYGKNEDERLEPYSTTKLLTCYIVLENMDPDQVVTVSSKATRAYENGTTIWLKAGEKISIRDLLYGAMLESGNDAAYALGEAVAGSEEAFADIMNNTAAAWGCKDTHFVNANGWKHKDHYSTARDMAVITAKCLENEKLREIAMTKEYTVPATNLSGERDLKNYFMHVTGNPEGLTGGKTGTWDDDDCAVVCSFSQTGLDAVIVVLGDTEDGRPEDVRKLMAFSHEVTPGFIVPAAGAEIKTAWVRHGEKTRTVLKADGHTYSYPEDNSAESVRTEIKYDKLEAPISKGQEVGTLQVYAGEELVGEHKLIATEDIETGWLPSYVYISNHATLNALKVIGAFILLMVIVSMIARLIRGGKNPKKRKRRKPSRAQGTQVRREVPETGSRRSAETGGRMSSSADRRRSMETSGTRKPETGSRRNPETTGRNKPETSSRKEPVSTGRTAPKQSDSKKPVSSRKAKKEARERLREKYRDKH